MKRPLHLLLVAVMALIPITCYACKSVPENATPEERSAIVAENFEELTDFLAVAEVEFLSYIESNAPEKLPQQQALVKAAKNAAVAAHAAWQRTGSYDLSDLREVLGTIADGYVAYIEADDGLDDDAKARRLQNIRLGRYAGDFLLRRLENLSTAGIQHEPDALIDELALARVAEHTLSRTVMASAYSARGGDHLRVLDVGDPGGDRLATAGVGCDWHRF